MKNIYNQAVRSFKEAGIKSAEIDARILLFDAANIDFNNYILYPELKLSMEKEEIFKNYVNRRLNKEPVAKIIGKKYFWKSSFIVNQYTLDPRPDTEVIIEQAYQFLEDKNKPYKFLDLGTGSGCIILSLLLEFPNAFGYATDISDKTLEIANKNAQELKLSNKVNFFKSDWFDKIDGEYDLIVSNPPYIPTKDIDGLDIDVKNYDPLSALDGGEDGLTPYRIIEKDLRKFLKPTGIAIFEFGYGQAQDIKKIFSNFTIEKIAKDLAGIERAIILRR